MALLKVWRTMRQYGTRTAYKKIKQVAPTYLGGIKNWELRRCRCCERATIFIAQQSGSGESSSCFFCSANDRYELLAEEIRNRYGSKLSQMSVLELDPCSPLRPLLGRARTYIRSFYEEDRKLKEKNGAVWEDIAELSFQDNFFDLIVSSEVLEHVPRLDCALQESARVLKVGGAHLFTVPPRSRTRKRAELSNGKITHLETPDYHMDPLCKEGILAFWDVGPDLADVVTCPGLNVRVVRGPEGSAGRVVWMAEKVAL